MYHLHRRLLSAALHLKLDLLPAADCLKLNFLNVNHDDVDAPQPLPQQDQSRGLTPRPTLTVAAKFVFVKVKVPKQSLLRIRSPRRGIPCHTVQELALADIAKQKYTYV